MDGGAGGGRGAGEHLLPGPSSSGIYSSALPDASGFARNPRLYSGESQGAHACAGQGPGAGSVVRGGVTSGHPRGVQARSDAGAGTLGVYVGVHHRHAGGGWLSGGDGGGKLG